MSEVGTPPITARVPPELLTTVRARNPELADLPDAPLLRFAMAFLAGITVGSALPPDELQRLIEVFGPQRSGPKPRKRPSPNGA